MATHEPFNLGNYQEPQPFKYWCQKMLPLVYDDSLSYYELLSKVVDYINKLAADDNTLIAEVTALKNWFDNLDVSEEINAKLDEMAENGELYALIEPYLDDLSEYIRTNAEQQQTYNERTREILFEENARQIVYNRETRTVLQNMVGHPYTANSAEAMTDTDKVYVYTGTTTASLTNGHWYFYDGTAWTDGGVYNSTALETDKTLLVDGAAADARYTGIRLNGITTVFPWVLNSNKYNLLTGESETIEDPALHDYANTGKFACTAFSGIAGFDRTHTDGCAVVLVWDNDTYIGVATKLGWFDTNNTSHTLDTIPYFNTCLVQVYADVWETDYSDAYSDAIRRINPGTDKELKTAGVAADGKRTGDEITGLKSDLKNYNVYDMLHDVGTFANSTSKTVIFSWNTEKTQCAVNGTATGGFAFNNIRYDASTLPLGFEAGKTYPVIYETTDSDIVLEMIAYLDGATSGGVSTIIKESSEYAVPTNCTGLNIRLRVDSGKTADGTVNKIAIINTLSNSDLKKNIDENYSDLIFDESNLYNQFDLSTLIWTEGKQVNSNGAEGNNSKASACMYLFAPKGSRFYVLYGFMFNIATYSAPTASAKTDYRTWGTDEYITSTDCYVKISIINKDNSTAVTSEIAKSVLRGLVIANTKANDYKSEVQSIVDFLNIPLENGTINPDGSMADATNRVRSARTVFLKKNMVIKNPSGVSVNWRNYNDEEGADFFSSGGSWTTGDITVGDNKYYKFIFQKNNYMNGRLSQYLSMDNNNIQKDHETRIEALEFIAQPLRGMPIVFPPSSPYHYNGSAITETIINGSGNLLAPLYDLYDALETAHPNHITKELLGYDQSGLYEIRAYTIQQHQAPISKPVILWVSGVHASETYTHTTTYMFVKELLENHDNDDVLGFIWRNCVFKVIPIGNPWGLANGASRYNSRGVNLNRNFNADWEYSTDEYNNSGSAPESEAETQAIVDFVNSNLSSAIFAVNKHDSGTDVSLSGRIAYSVDDFRIDLNILRVFYAQMQTVMLKNYPWLSQNRPSSDYTMMFNSLSTATDHGTMDKWFSTVGLHGCLLEVSRPDDTGYTADKKQDFLQMNLEVSVNMISAMLEKNQLLLSSDAVWYKYNVVE